MERKKIETSLTSLVKIVSEKGGVRLTEASELLATDEESLESIAKILAKKKILEIHYSFKGYKILKKGEMIKPATVPTHQEQKSFPASKTEEEKEPGEIEEVFRIIRTKRHERRKAGMIESRENADAEKCPIVTEAANNDQGNADKELTRLRDVFEQIRSDVERVRRKMEEEPVLKKEAEKPDPFINTLH